MDQGPGEAAKAKKSNFQEMGSDDQKFIKMTEQEEDIIYRMYRLVGERWDLIAGRIPGRKAEEIERFWMTRRREMFAEKRNKDLQGAENSSTFTIN